MTTKGEMFTGEFRTNDSHIFFVHNGDADEGGDDNVGGASIEEYLKITGEQNILINWYAATNPGYGIYTAYNKATKTT